MPYRRLFAQVFGFEAIIAASVFVLVSAVMVIAFLISRRRRKRGAGSSARAEHNPAEIVYAAAVAAVAAVIATVSLTANTRETGNPQARPALQVQVTAFQWCWQFRYAGQPVSVTGQCQGRSLPTLMLPAGVPVRISVTSRDVIHAFWLPYLRWKLDAFPGHVSSFVVTLEHQGRWLGRCAQFCGLYHYQMDFWVQAVSPAQFDHWLQARGGSAVAVTAP
jgi:cytochrome c oxidase subunit 2